MEEARPEPASGATALTPTEVKVPEVDSGADSAAAGSVPAGPTAQTLVVSAPKPEAVSLETAVVKQIMSAPDISAPIPTPSSPTSMDQDPNHRLAEETLGLARATKFAA